MHSGLQRICNTQKIADGENSSISRKSLEQNNFRTSLNDCEESSFVWRNSDHRCAILTFLALEPNGHWRIVAVPLQCPDHVMHLGFGAQIKLDGLHLVSPSSVGSVKVDRQKAPRRPTTDKSCSVKSLTARSLPGSNFQHQSQNKGLVNKVSKWNQLVGNSSCQNSFSSCDSSFLFPRGSNDATNSSDMYIDISQVDKAVKKNSRKKSRKKGKRNKKLSCDTGLNELGCAHESSELETGINKNMDHEVGLLPYATTLPVSLPVPTCNGNDSEGNGTFNCTETPKTCTSYTDKVDVSEAFGCSLLQNFTGEHILSNSENEIQTSYSEISISNGGVQDTHSKGINCFDDPYSDVFSEKIDSLVFDSVSVGSNSDESSNAAYDVKISNKESGEITASEPSGYVASKGCFSRGNMSHGVADSYCHAEGTNYGKPGCTGSDIHLAVPAKRGKKIQRVPRNSSVYRLSSVGNLYGHSGKENNHSVWQKVLRNDADDSNYELEKASSVCSQFDIGLEETPSLKKNCNIVESNILSNYEDKRQSKLKVSRKLKWKTSPGSKQDYNCYSRKGSHAMETSSNVSMKIDMQQNEILDIPAQRCSKKGLASVSRPHSKIGSPSIGFQTKRVESISSEQVHCLQVCPGEVDPLDNVDTTVSSLNDQTTQNQSSLSSRSSDYLDQSELLKVQSAVYLHPLVGDEGAKEQKDVSPTEHSKQDHNSGSIVQKWIPVGIKDSVLTTSGCSNDNIGKSAAESWTLKNIAEEELASDPHTLPSSVNARVMCTVQGSGNHNGLPFEDEGQAQKLRHRSTCSPKEYCINNAAAQCLVCESKDQSNSAFENDSNKMAQAVNDAYRAQLASEAAQMATGCPIAEFEKFLHSASPVICLPHNGMSCQTCSHDEVVGEPLCRHETPIISLRSLWQWYEKHGSYGLEVRTEDYENSKRLGIDRFASRAYFVPFLSAVQLFGNQKSHPPANRNDIPCTEAMEARKVDKTSKNSSNVGCLPIFSVLVPQRRTEDTNSLPSRNHGCCSQLFSECIKDNVSIQPVDTVPSDDLELLFEYFEDEQPQRRQPFFEMIKELIKGDGPSQCRAYGEPTALDSVDLHDLHPNSWYSVAWYPIYRIPDGNFRAAFLTYHSLGHLVHRSSTSDSFGVDACIVSPVVGLQSYNAQGECWFQPRHSGLSQTTENPNLDPSGILKERLRTLEQMASLMARGVVTKGNLTSVNRQPDYEFFVSRRH
uniref:Uncharacterized protein n=1 Tax=Davidia involucrata TaxID=16924 RepID=A0A5B7AHA2_DAVIN